MKTLNAAGQALLNRAIAGEKIPLVPLLYLGLPVPQRYALGGVGLTWGGNTWAPRDVGIEEVSDSIDQPASLRITLPGVTDSERALALSSDVEGSRVELYLALVDPLTMAVGDAPLRWAGELDMPGFQAGRKATVFLTATHRGVIALRDRISRYTNDEQQRLFSGDTSLNVDPATDAGQVVWPAAGYFKQ